MTVGEFPSNSALNFNPLPIAASVLSLAEGYMPLLGVGAKAGAQEIEGRASHTSETRSAG